MPICGLKKKKKNVCYVLDGPEFSMGLVRTAEEGLSHWNKNMAGFE